MLGTQRRMEEKNISEGTWAADGQDSRAARGGVPMEWTK